MAKISTYSSDESPSLTDYLIMVDQETGENKKLTLNNLSALLLATSTPVGMMIPFAASTIPSGFLECAGQAVSRDDYADLFDAIGTTYGVGDGSTTFNVPDLRGRVVAGQDDMGGTSANRLTDQSGGVDGDVLGDSGGAETHTLLTAEMPAHKHGIRAGGNTFANAASQNIVGGGSALTDADDQGLITDTGGGGAHNNVQPTIIANYIIKA